MMERGISSRGRPEGRPFFLSHWSQALRALALFELALVLCFLAPAATVLIDPPYRGTWTVIHDTPRAHGTYRLQDRLDDGTPVQTVCTAVGGSRRKFECRYAGAPFDGVLRLQQQQLDGRTSFTESYFEPDLRLTLPLPPLWLGVLQAIALALWWWRQPESRSSLHAGRSAWWWCLLPLATAAGAGAVLPDEDSGFLRMLGDAFSTHPATTVLAVALAAPVVEELLFRGAGWNLLHRAFGTGWTLALTTLSFALVHGNQYALPGLLAVAATGLALGLVRVRTGSVAACILAHALVNGAALAGIALG